MRVRIFFFSISLCALSSSPLFAQNTTEQNAAPLSSAYFKAVPSPRVDWHAIHSANAHGARRSDCPLNGFRIRCFEVFAPSYSVSAEERQYAESSPAILDKPNNSRAIMRLYGARRGSLYEMPLPVLPITNQLKPDIDDLQAPEKTISNRPEISEALLISQIRTLEQNALDKFDRFINDESDNLSLEKTDGSAIRTEALAFWKRAARQGQRCARTRTDEECYKVAILSSAPSKSHYALCSVDSGFSHSFLTKCRIVALTDGNTSYVLTYVGPPGRLGAGPSFTDSFGEFALRCPIPQGARSEKLARVRTHFKLGGDYKVTNDRIDIRAYSPFQHFPEAGKFGRFRMVSNRDFTVDNDVTFSFIGKWWDKNIDADNAIPSFDDGDAEVFKRAFERALGLSGTTCELHRSQN